MTLGKYIGKVFQPVKSNERDLVRTRFNEVGRGAKWTGHNVMRRCRRENILSGIVIEVKVQPFALNTRENKRSYRVHDSGLECT